MKTHTPEQVAQTLREMARMKGSQAALAREIGVSPSYMHDAIKGKVLPQKKVLEFLGMEKVTETIVKFREVE